MKAGLSCEEFKVLSLGLPYLGSRDDTSNSCDCDPYSAFGRVKYLRMSLLPPYLSSKSSSIISSDSGSSLC